jgi:hypothetical protein
MSPSSLLILAAAILVGGYFLSKPTQEPLVPEQVSKNQKAPSKKAVPPPTAAVTGELKAPDPVKSEPVDYDSLPPREKYRFSIIRSKGLAIKGLHLSPTDEQLLIELLIERVQVGFDARDALYDYGSRHLSDLDKVNRAAKDDVDAEILAKFGKDIADKVRVILQNSDYSHFIGNTLAGKVADLGAPLSGDQALATIFILFESYGPDFMVSKLLEQQKFDLLGDLTIQDKAAILKASKTLDAVQIAALTELISARNSHYRKSFFNIP